MFLRVRGPLDVHDWGGPRALKQVRGAKSHGQTTFVRLLFNTLRVPHSHRTDEMWMGAAGMHATPNMNAITIHYCTVSLCACLQRTKEK